MQNDGQRIPHFKDEAGFMIFDTVLAFDHVQHRILIIANARITPDDDLEALYSSRAPRSISRARAAAGSLASRSPGRARHRGDIERAARALSGDGQDREGSTSRRRHSIRSCCRSGSKRRSARIRLPSIARCAM
jgi:hypothetical protein